ncbi:molybdenum-pterin binding domain protein [Thioflavicoccus mobilis 8321]|uniref:Molybdenum-pterin binding domain protein n=1 Tax=Thioflavicoccus mobilis 8321 TaxID=765912 RepID=L0GRQ9_9GAMM|nr:TOBE domain-containing protein [Thioflavicoccus mobilis]AGA89458.1 molybdenum-pterin binding domain protein [Thioflavicoccus mobilis 8321]
MTDKLDQDLDTAAMLRLDLNQHHFVGQGRIELLRRIGETGSISRAAKVMQMSYKQAWDAVDAMNNLSARPLVRRQAGGHRGGGTELTDEGRRLIAVYETAAREHQRFLARLRDGIRDFDRFHSLLGALSMKVSTRNHLRGVVQTVTPGAVNAEVTLDLNGTPLVAIVTQESVRSLGLTPGVEAYALVKASFVILTTADGGLKTSARNRLCGTVARITEGPVNAEVVLALDGGVHLTAIITIESLHALELVEGGRACALIKAPHVILAVED